MNSRSSAGLAVLDATIRTLDFAHPHATAVAVREGTIVAVGDDAEVRAACDGATELIDGSGMALVPGLVDSHCHPFAGALETRGADLDGAATIDEVRLRLAAERRRCAEGAWVRGHSLAYSVFSGIQPSGELFVDAVGGSPALLTFFDFHTALVTPAGLAAAGIDGARSFEDSSEIVCREDGTPTGELRELAIGLVTDVLPEVSKSERVTAIGEALAAMNRTGLTACHMMDGSFETPELCRELEQEGLLTARQVVPYTVTPAADDAEVDAAIAMGAQEGMLWRSGWAKFFIDGVVETGTAWLDEPDSHGRGLHPHWPDPERYAAVVRRFAQAGLPCITHAIGDRAVRCALDAYRAAGRVARAPHRVEHIETLKDRDLPRFAAEGVVASQQAIHLQWEDGGDHSDPWSVALGPERCARGFRLGDLRRSGAILALGSDWPVAGYDPRAGMSWARLRRTPGRPQHRPYLGGQCLSALEALEGYTTEAAKAVGDQDVAGRIAPGMRADLTAFAEDPVECSADELPHLPVRLTVVGGRVTHRT